MQRTNIYLEERQTAALDEVAQRDGVTRAEVVRRLIDRGLDAELGAIDTDLQALDDAFGVLGDDVEHVPERGPSARDVHLQAVWDR